MQKRRFGFVALSEGAEIPGFRANSIFIRCMHLMLGAIDKRAGLIELGKKGCQRPNLRTILVQMVYANLYSQGTPFHFTDMANQEIKKVGAPSQLQTESLRFTVFLPANQRVGNQSWWTELVGVEPESRNSRPNIGQLLEAGPVRAYGLVLAINPGRVDWILTPKQEEGVPPESRWAGPLDETLPFFVELMTQWFAFCPPVVRLALGAVLHEPMRDRQEAYSRLAQYLPTVQIDPEGSSEFFYQVNRPRKSKTIEGMRINRLSKWSAALTVPVRFSISLGQTQGQMEKVGDGEQTCRIELDISTDQESTEKLSPPILPALLMEFMDLAKEIVADGDIR
jgi:hypothetical protein